MKTNIGDGERLIRVLAGVYVMLLGFLFIQGAVGIIPVSYTHLTLPTTPYV